MPAEKGRITRWLAEAPQPVFVLYAIAASFATYFCMYAFRKPFAAAKFEGFERFWLLDLKTALVISQIVGYTLSKYIGIKVCSEIKPYRRCLALILLILWAELAWVLFGLVPSNLKVAAAFLNGIPLGMVWGMVVWYLEGRRTSELLLAGLSCSYIVASGVVKDVGRAIMTAGVSEQWMPAVTGLCFLPAFLIAVLCLDQIPHATPADIASRVEREPMSGRERLKFFGRFSLGLLLLLTVYFFLTAYRDFRDNYGVEIFQAIGYDDEPAIFTTTEFPVALGVLAALAGLNLIQDHRRGLIGAYVIMTSGLVLMAGSTLLMDAGFFAGRQVWWMILVGLGSFLAYVPYGTVLFERLIASTRAAGTAVFAIYVADAVGYTGSISVQLYKDLGQSELSRFEFFRWFTYAMSMLGVVLLLCSCLYFLPQTRRKPNVV